MGIETQHGGGGAKRRRRRREKGGGVECLMKDGWNL